MIEIADRLIVDSAEWPDVPGAYAELEDVFEAAAVSDIAWRRRCPGGRRWPPGPSYPRGSPARPPRRRPSPPGCTPGLESRWCARALTKFLTERSWS